MIGSGPNIGRAVTEVFASKRYSNVVLIARRASQLEEEQKALEQAVGQGVKVKTFAVDVVDSESLVKALDDAEAHFGKPECIFYNAARVLPSQFFEHTTDEMEYDFKVNHHPLPSFRVSHRRGACRGWLTFAQTDQRVGPVHGRQA